MSSRLMMRSCQRRHQRHGEPARTRILPILDKEAYRELREGTEGRVCWQVSKSVMKTVM